MPFSAFLPSTFTLRHPRQRASADVVHDAMRATMMPRLFTISFYTYIHIYGYGEGGSMVIIIYGEPPQPA